MAETDEETERHNDNTCMFPDCDRPAVETKPRGPGREGWKARYCDNEEHNAVNMHLELKKREQAEA